MAESVENSGSDKITITVKTPKEKHDVQVTSGATVKEVNYTAIIRFSFMMDNKDFASHLSSFRSLYAIFFLFFKN